MIMLQKPVCSSLSKIPEELFERLQRGPDGNGPSKRLRSHMRFRTLGTSQHYCGSGFSSALFPEERHHGVEEE